MLLRSLKAATEGTETQKNTGNGISLVIIIAVAGGACYVCRKMYKQWFYVALILQQGFMYRWKLWLYPA
jgi:hypothetical protein